MTPAETKIARSLVAMPGWRWLAGMLTDADTHGRRWRRIGYGVRSWVQAVGPTLRDGGLPRSPLPDLSDPLTALGVLHLVRLAWGDETFHAAPFTENHGQVRWCVSGMHRGREYEGDTEIKAIAAALKAAPTPEAT